MKSAAPRQEALCGVLNHRQTFYARLSSAILQPASPMQAEKYSIFNAVAGPPPARRARNHENRQTSHAKTSILPLRVLKTSSLVTRARATHPAVPELWVLEIFQKKLWPPQERFPRTFFRSKTASENRRFFEGAPGRSFYPI